MRRAPTPTLFPYTTLFRSRGARRVLGKRRVGSNRAEEERREVVRVDAATGKDDHQILVRHHCGPLPASAHGLEHGWRDRKSTRLNSSHVENSYAVFCLKKK